MDDSVVTFAVFLVDLFLISGLNTGEQVQWRVVNKIVKYGDDLTLVCILDKTLENEEGTSNKRWYNGPDLCSINDHTTNSTKYSAWVDDEGAKLTILNFNLDDLNETYYCEIGFYKSTKLILSTEIVFSDQKSKNDLPENNEKPGNHLTPVIIIIVVIAGVLTTIFGWFLRKLLRKKTCPRNTDLGEQNSYRECLADG